MNSYFLFLLNENISKTNLYNSLKAQAYSHKGDSTAPISSFSYIKNNQEKGKVTEVYVHPKYTRDLLV